MLPEIAHYTFKRALSVGKKDGINLVEFTVKTRFFLVKKQIRPERIEFFLCRP
jgi:hypothetical protein